MAILYEPRESAAGSKPILIATFLIWAMTELRALLRFFYKPYRSNCLGGYTQTDLCVHKSFSVAELLNCTSKGSRQN